MTSAMENEGIQSAEQRSDERRDGTGGVRLVVDGATLPGELSNLSAGGVMFTCAEGLDVVVEYRDGDRDVRREGTLVRVQRMNADELALAVEFREPDGDGAPRA